MGFRRLRGRLNQLQGEANQTMGIIQDAIADFQDGFGVRVKIDRGAAKTLMGILMGKEGELPLTIEIDPTVDTKD